MKSSFCLIVCACVREEITKSTELNMIDRNTSENVFKILILGDSKVGKTSILTQFASATFNPNTLPTLGIDYKIKRIPVDGQDVKLQIWDTAGQERFRSITESFYKGTKGIILTFDLTDHGTFRNLSTWVLNIKQHAGDKVIRVLVGNKSDLTDSVKVKKEDIEAFMKEIGEQMPYFETSAKTGLNIKEIFDQVARDILKNEALHEGDFLKESVAGSKLYNQNAGRQEERPTDTGCCGT